MSWPRFVTYVLATDPPERPKVRPEERIIRRYSITLGRKVRRAVGL
jgi:hypothetical protein